MEYEVEFTITLRIAIMVNSETKETAGNDAAFEIISALEDIDEIGMVKCLSTADINIVDENEQAYAEVIQLIIKGEPTAVQGGDAITRFYNAYSLAQDADEQEIVLRAWMRMYASKL